MSRNIVIVKAAAVETGDAANGVFDAATKLTEQAERLKAEVSAFLTKARAA